MRSLCISFEPGDADKQVEITLIDNGRWNTITELDLLLTFENTVNAHLGRYLKRAWIKILDDTGFPGEAINKVESREIVDGEVVYIVDGEAVSSWRVLIEYFKMNWAIPIVRRGTLKMVLVDALHNVCHLAHLYLSVYLLDGIVDKKLPLVLIHDRVNSLVAYAVLSVVVVGLMHMLSTKVFHRQGDKRNAR